MFRSFSLVSPKYWHLFVYPLLIILCKFNVYQKYNKWNEQDKIIFRWVVFTAWNLWNNNQKQILEIVRSPLRRAVYLFSSTIAYWSWFYCCIRQKSFLRNLIFQFCTQSTNFTPLFIYFLCIYLSIDQLIDLFIFLFFYLFIYFFIFSERKSYSFVDAEIHLEQSRLHIQSLKHDLFLKWSLSEDVRMEL